MINAAVSHELRNPLNSIITQKYLLNSLISHFKDINNIQIEN